MTQVYFARHVGYTQGGFAPVYSGNVQWYSGSAWTQSGCIPIVRELPAIGCKDVSTFYQWAYGARHIDYAKTDNSDPIYWNSQKGVARFAVSQHCCESSYELPHVEYDCLTLVSGISPIIYGHSQAVQNCISSDGQLITFNYGGGTDISGNIQWVGNLYTRGGTLQLKMSCMSGTEDYGPPYSPPQFRVEWRGCNSGSIEVFPSCLDPLFINFANIGPLPDCCDCNDSTETGETNVYVTGNCNPVLMGRHIGYSRDGTPVVAAETSCNYNADPPINCTSTHCGLVATITSLDGACSCMQGTYDLAWLLGAWQNLSNPVCGHVMEILMDCVDGTDGNTTLAMHIVCGADNVGTGEVTIASWMMEDLDVTFYITMIWSGGAACGTCRWQWNEMPMSWTMLSDNCTGVGTCACLTPPGNGIPGAGQGYADGTQIDYGCSGGTEVPCCQGQIAVRVMRQ